MKLDTIRNMYSETPNEDALEFFTMLSEGAVDSSTPRIRQAQFEDLGFINYIPDSSAGHPIVEIHLKFSVGEIAPIQQIHFLRSSDESQDDFTVEISFSEGFESNLNTVTEHVFSGSEIGLLKGFKQAKWLNVSSNSMPTKTMATDWLNIHTSNGSARLTCYIENVNLDRSSSLSAPLQVTRFKLAELTDLEANPELYQNRFPDQPPLEIHEVWIVKDQTRCRIANLELFDFTTIRAVVFNTSKHWIIMWKDSYWTNTFYIDVAKSQEEIKLRDPNEEWDSPSPFEWEFDTYWVKL